MKNENLISFENESRELEKIFDILKANRILSEASLLQLKKNENHLLYAGDYPWVGDVARVINGFYSRADRFITDTTGKVFLVDQMKENDHEDLLKYSCVFPNRMIISAGNFVYLDDPDQAFVDLELLKKLLWSKSLLNTGLVHISPFARYTDKEPGKGNLKNALVERLTLSEWNKKKIAELDKCGVGNADTPLVDKKCLFLAIPWLKHARLDDYLEIIKGNEKEFENYNLTVTRMLDSNDDIDKLIRDLGYDFREANTNIAIALEKKKNELKSKGITTLLSFTVTMIPLMIPGINEVDPALISTLLGTPGIVSLMNMIPDLVNVKDTGKENPFWVLWKWKNTVG